MMLLQGLADAAIYTRAWRRVRRPGGAGLDGVDARAFERDLDRRLARLQRDLVTGTYRPEGLLRRTAPKPDGRVRRLGIPTVRDRLAQAVVLELVQPVVDPLFRPEVFGYRPGRGPQHAVGHLVTCLAQRREPLGLVVKVDVSELFDRLEHRRLAAACRAALPGDSAWDGLLATWRASWACSPGRGVPQGAPLSPLQANLYLHATVDRALSAEQRVRTWIRYGDDIVVVAGPGVAPSWMLGWLAGVVRAAGLALSAPKTAIRVVARPGSEQLVVLGQTLTCTPAGLASLSPPHRSVGARLPGLSLSHLAHLLGGSP